MYSVSSYTSYTIVHYTNEVETVLVERETNMIDRHDTNSYYGAHRYLASEKGRDRPLGDISNISRLPTPYQQVSEEVALKWLAMGPDSVMDKHIRAVTHKNAGNIAGLRLMDPTDRCTRMDLRGDRITTCTSTSTRTLRTVGSRQFRPTTTTGTCTSTTHHRSHNPRPSPVCLNLLHRGKMTGSHWKSAQDPNTGRTYYYHEITRETQWRKPPELASEAERKAMEEKERKQKDFFAAMEANILNSLSQGQVPGTPTLATMERRKSSRRPVERPELVRTISTMDDIVLKNMIQRQPSFRNIPKSALSKTASLNPNDFENAKRPSHIGAEDFESFVSLMSDHTRRLDPLQEATARDDDSLPELFSYLPDEGEYSVSEFTTGDSSFRSDGGKLNESSLTGFGLTWEETQALKKLATITKEMIQAEKEEEEEQKKNGLNPTWKAKDNKGMRDLPREIELDESDDESDSVPETSASVPPFQKAKDIGGRDFDFDSDEEEDDDDDDTDTDEEEETLDMAPTPMQSKASKTTLPTKKEDVVPQRPEIKRRNTCGTLYVGTTMSAPDKDATIKVRIHHAL